MGKVTGQSMLPLLVTSVLVAFPARADRRALSLDVGAGLSFARTPAPYSQPLASTFGRSAFLQLGGRYALDNHFEVALTGFWEPPVTYFHGDTTLVVPSGSFVGTLRHQLTRLGVSAGVRYVRGMVWRLVAGLDVGLSHRTFGDLQHVAITSGGATDYNLGLADLSATNPLLVPMLGVEWAHGDHWSVSVIPRVHFMFGPQPTFSLVVPLSFSWAWYL